MSHETEVFRSCEYWRPISYCPVRLSSFSMSPIYTEQGDSSGRVDWSRVAIGEHDLQRNGFRRVNAAAFQFAFVVPLSPLLVVDCRSFKLSWKGKTMSSRQFRCMYII